MRWYQYLCKIHWRKFYFLVIFFFKSISSLVIVLVTNPISTGTLILCCGVFVLRLFSLTSDCRSTHTINSAVFLNPLHAGIDFNVLN